MAQFDPFLSLDCASVEGGGCNQRKGRDQILQRSVAEPKSFKSEGPNTYNSKNPAIAIWQLWMEGGK